MAHTRLRFRDEARGKVLAGATLLADAIRVTLGPRAKSILIEKKWGGPLVCDDGVTIAKAMNLEDPEENLGVEMLRKAVTKLPRDVEEALQSAYEAETDEVPKTQLQTILTNIRMAEEGVTPICQDTGTPIFYVHYPIGWSTRQLRTQIHAAVAEATRRASSPWGDASRSP